MEGMLGKERFSFPSCQAEAAFSINSRSLIFNSIMKCISPIVSIHLLPHLEHAPGNPHHGPSQFSVQSLVCGNASWSGTEGFWLVDGK